MQKITEAKSGIYCLEIFLESPIKLGIKKYSGIFLQPGFYYYVGSAQKNYNQRLRRHFQKDKTIHWHIDHLTSHPKIKFTKVYLIENANKQAECSTVISMEKLKNVEHPLKGFGNSDCSNCESHLLFSKTAINQSHFISLYQDIVLFKPSDKDIFCS